ncbi:hypothetical protein QBC46DRAFT_347381 [Diplogelasinospora grovesii]|uniref:Uncharacterized protein n=1 Tax=Diplogelasinospora grovesii TaxID=303347 RepID=A0AAN6MY90_9PEZI|nr:hypothetical protein QBC46DRAFT_347381 [Diplogelasinospora grovesii]
MTPVSTAEAQTQQTSEDRSSSLPVQHLVSPSSSLSLFPVSSSQVTSSKTDSPPAMQSAQESFGTISSGSGGSVASASAPPIPSNSAINNRAVWPHWQVPTSVLGNHMPMVVARGFMLVLGAFYNQLLVHEPVRQMTSGGIAGAALAGTSFGTAHIGMYAAQIGTAFSAGATFVDTNYCSSAPTANDLNPCSPRLSTNPWVLDVILVTLAIQVLVIVYSMSKWFQKPGGLSADPTTIAGVAAVMGHPEIERQFAALPGEMSKKELKEALKDQKFKLGSFTTETGLTKYGIMPVSGSEKEKAKDKKKAGFFSKLGTRSTTAKKQPLYFDLIFAAFLLALLGLTLAAVSNVDHPQTVFLASASGNGTGMKIFFAILGIIVSFYWGKLFNDTQTYTPYFPLRDGEARPSPTILLNRHTSPLCALLPLVRNRHIVAASVAFTGLIAELLIITLAGLPYRPGQLRSEFLFCSIASVGILFLMAVQLVLVNIWRRSLPHLPRRPDTTAAVMTYVAGTSMVRDFYGLEELSTRERNRAIERMGKVYAYGWKTEDDGGRVRWIVDEARDQERKSFLSGSSGEPEGTERQERHERYV